MDNKFIFPALFKKVLFLTGMSKSSIFFLLLIAVLTFLACDRDRIYDESLQVPAEGWHMDSALLYDFYVEDTLIPYKFFINIRHNTDYRYSNIFLFVDTRFPNGNITRDTIEFLLADRQGEWYGNGVGKIRDNSILIHEGIRFPRKGEYTFRIVHGMRKKELQGVEDIGIRFERMN